MEVILNPSGNSNKDVISVGPPHPLHIGGAQRHQRGFRLSVVGSPKDSVTIIIIVEWNV